MAALDFPASSSSPWTDPNGTIWVWNGTGWAQKIPYPGSAAEILNTVVPSISAGPGETGSDIGDTITLDHGTWLNAASYIDTWYMADAVGVATQLTVAGSSYLRSSADQGQAIYVVIVGVGAYGGNSAPLTTNIVGKRKLTYTATGSFESWQVPNSVYSLDIKCWGASESGSKGWGGFSLGTLAVNPGDWFTVVVGRNNVSYPFGGGGYVGSGQYPGGLTGLFNGNSGVSWTSGTDQARMVISAGGAGSSASPWEDAACGGDGGGETGWYGFGSHSGNGGGQNCDYPTTSGDWTTRAGGSQTGPGAGGSTMRGGGDSHCNWWYGSGGGGYWGGAHGQCSGGCHVCGGSGGSGYIGNTTHPQAALSNAFTYRGSESQMYEQSDYISGVARHDQGGDGQGMLLIYF